MSKTPPLLVEAGIAGLAQLGEQIRARRTELALSATDAAEAAGTSRVTLHRIEKGNPSVAVGFYISTLSALGLELKLATVGTDAEVPGASVEDGWVPVAIRVDDYPELKRLAWHVKEGATLRPVEALGIYERHRKHLDEKALSDQERALIEGLRKAWGQGEGNVSSTSL